MPVPLSVAVIGGGPGGLMAAERLATAGLSVTVYEQMPSVGRKFLLAGRGGLNLTHSEPIDRMIERYGDAASRLAPAVRAFDAAALRSWAEGLGEPTFVGSSGRVFPESLRATPLLRAWLTRLTDLGVEIRTRHRWTAMSSAAGHRVAVTVVSDAPSDARTDAVGDSSAVVADASTVVVDAVVLATGGVSWPKVGSDGAWALVLAESGVGLAPFRAANSGFVAPWSDVFRTRFAGEPLKNVAVSVGGHRERGEGVVTDSGVEGGVFYALGSVIRDEIEGRGEAMVEVDFHPDLAVEALVARLDRRRPKDSTSSALRKAGLAPVAIALMREVTGNDLPHDSAALAALAKSAPLRLVGVESVDRAISTAGGVRFDDIDDGFMLRGLPGVFVVGEMLDWEAPTGGYLLQATFSTAVAAAAGVMDYLADRDDGGFGDDD